MAKEEGPQVLPVPQGAHDPLAPHNPKLPPDPQNPPPSQNPQMFLLPNAPQVPPAPEGLHLSTLHLPLLNWSHFKPEYSRKPDKDTGAHLLRPNDLMDTHGFQDNVKMRCKHCLTLTGEDRLWYESLRLINIDWSGLQNIFRQQYSKIGNTRGQLFTLGDLLTQQKHGNNRCLCTAHKTGSHTLRLSKTTNIRSLQKHTSNKIILGSFPNNGLETSSRNSKKNFDKGKDRQTVSRTDFLDSIHEHKRRVL